jgi:hypothetical protein
MSKTVSLKNSTALEVVKSAEKLPAPQAKREYADFDIFVENVDKLTALIERASEDQEHLSDIEFEWVEKSEDHAVDLKAARAKVELVKRKVQLARYTLREFPSARKREAACKRDEKWYDRKELYDIKGKGKREKWTLSRRVVSEQIGMLLGSFQNARPGTPKVFARMLTEEVYAYNPNACVLESACRYVRREQDFPPSIAELLKAIKKETSAWSDRWDTLQYGIGTLQQDLERDVAEAEAKIAEAEPKLAAREAKERAEEERRRLYREAYDPNPIRRAAGL